ncbi:MAG: hypothetical protein U1E65_16655 [Myxococcota bacterium]
MAGVYPNMKLSITSILSSLALAAGLLACGGTERDSGESNQAALRSLGAIGDACTVDGKSGKCSNDDCTKCTVDGTCWVKANDGSWLICLKDPFGK